MNNPVDALNRMMAFGTLLMLFGLLLSFVCFVFWLIALVRCITTCPKEDRTVWILVIIFVPLFGWLLYFIIGPKTSGPAIAQAPPFVPPPVPPAFGGAPSVDDAARAVAEGIQNSRKRSL